jgi:HYDIN/CFA65/VesB family protein
MKRFIAFAALVYLCFPAAAQISVLQVGGQSEQPVGSIFSFGPIGAGETTAASFRVRNIGNSAAQINNLAVAGTGFLLVASPPPPALDPQASFDFLVSFQPAAAGSYSATLQAGGTSVLLVGTAVPALTYQVVSKSGNQSLGGPVDFGSAAVGDSTAVQFIIANRTTQALSIPQIAVSGADFSFTGALPAGTLQPSGSATFTVVFAPRQAGTRAGSLAIGTRTFVLTGNGQTPPPPNANLRLMLPVAQSGQQGTIAIDLDSAAAVPYSGTVTMTFTPGSGIAASAAPDPAIAFSSGAVAAPFSVAAGQTAAQFTNGASIAFATGTTAGTLVFTVQFAGATFRQTVEIAPAPAGVSQATAARQASSIAVHVSGFDNTRTAGKVGFTFYDAAGSAIAPGTVAVDSSSDFASYFRNSNLGGVFALTAVFPVSGDAARIAAFDVSITNSQGVTRTVRTSF